MPNSSSALSLPQLDFQLDESRDDLAQHLISACKSCLSTWADVTKDGTEVRVSPVFMSHPASV